MELSYVLHAFIPAEPSLTMSVSITQLMVADYRCFILWKRHRLEVF